MAKKESTKSAKKSKNEVLQEKLFVNRKNSWSSYNPKEQEEIFKFSDEYKKFLDKSKTERLCIQNIIAILEMNGFRSIDDVKKAKPNDKVYKNIKGKSLIAFIVGKNAEEFRLVGSHIDCPRLDLKPSPLYEDSDLALLQTHYYGGVKKYHWVNVPLALHGVVFTKEGKKMTISIGEDNKDPKFIIPDLLPHLARNQMEKKPEKIVEGEELNILFGNLPVDDDKIKEQVKLNVMKKLNDDYGIVEEDFNCAELELVPAGNAMDIGIDRSMIGSYGQDDRVCAYTSLMALIELKNPAHTPVAFFVDKEEIGSMGDTGAASFILNNFAKDYAAVVGVNSSPNKILEVSKALSADVTAAMNPNYKDVNDPRNVSYLGKGVTLEKYGGAYGKFGTHDAHAEYMAYLRKILDDNKIPWQTGELGKIDMGGGGTIGMFLSRYGMDCVDIGPCVLGMHSPCEVTSKADVYASYRLFKAFLIG